MQKHNQAPHRRIVTEIHIGADSWKDLQESLTFIQTEIANASHADENLQWVNTGDNSGIDLCVKVDHSMTRDQYLNDMRNWKLASKGGLSK